MIKINVGCGQTPIDGWNNFDNSMSVLLAKHPFLLFIARKLKLLGKTQEGFILTVLKHNIKYADATRHIPEPNNSVEALYTSHMIEHLDFESIALFFKETRRVLVHGGTLRISTPDLKIMVQKYLKNGNSHELMSSFYLTDKPKTLADRVKYLFVAEREHQWMYDGKALCDLLASAEFLNPQVMDAGKTNIPEPGKLDLFERSEESVYVEARNP